MPISRRHFHGAQVEARAATIGVIGLPTGVSGAISGRWSDGSIQRVSSFEDARLVKILTLRGSSI